jgi:uncharacterized protein (TIGR02145 family)
MTVYTTKTVGDVTPGTYYNDGAKWVRLGSVPITITIQPKAFSWSRLKETNGDPNGPATATIAALSVTASGPGTLTYQWYRKSANPNAADTKLSGNGATTATYTPVVTSWGMQSYYCVVGNSVNNTVSAIAEVAIGCGAKTVAGGWVKFMCYNLGASDTTKDPFTFTANDTTILGKFYQWGRYGANHRAAKDTTNFTTNWAFPYDWMIPHGYNKAITNTYRQNDFLWRNYNTGIDPCPVGWHVPTQSTFGAIFKGTGDADHPDNAVANTWTSTGTWVNMTGNGGQAVKPDGVTTTLFFPSAGARGCTSGVLSDVGTNGNYWTSTVAGTESHTMTVHSAKVYPATTGYRGYGFSVRCVSEN